MAKAPIAEPEDLPYPQPWQRDQFIGDQQLDNVVRQMIDAHQLNNGWMITGPDGIGKASFAFRIARALLDPTALIEKNGLSIDKDSQTFDLVAQQAHPDLIHCTRPWDDKTKKLRKEIVVDVIHDMKRKLLLTPSMSNFRIAIIDKADEMNLIATNALLKILEEPPRNVLILLLCDAPGKMLPTIRSRCRMIELRPVAQAQIENLLRREGYCDPDESADLAMASNGRPGYAVRLAVGEGGRALSLIEDFIAGLTERPRLFKVAEIVSARKEDQLWRTFHPLLLETLQTEMCAKAAMDKQIMRHFPHASVPQMLSAYQQARDLLDQGNSLNADRGHLVMGLASLFRTLMKPDPEMVRHAG